MKKICEICGDEFEPAYRHTYQKYCGKRCKRIIKRIRLRTRVKEILSRRGCARCGNSDAIVLDFHHRNPEEKEFDVSVGIYTRGWKQIEREIAKCDVLCRNCHAIVHWEIDKEER